MTVARQCELCGKPLESRLPQAKYCPDPCRKKARRANYLRWKDRNPGKANEFTAAWYQRNLEVQRKVGRETAKRNPLRGVRKKGITEDQYLDMVRKQNNKCAICERTEPGGTGRWNIDHDRRCCSGSRSCGQCIRGLLCSRCNAGLGLLGDTHAHLLNALAYLEVHEIVNPPIHMQTAEWKALWPAESSVIFIH